MIQGTMSNAGKSLIVTGLCRIFKQDGYKVAPFKAQNMALNSYITEEGLEMGRAQVVQAQACGIKPSVDMNPILLKPTTDMGSQVIINGEVIGDMRAMDYYKHKKEYIPAVRTAYERLDREYDIIVIEGAGSPAEINLKQDDIVNMGMAKLADSPVLLVGDIDRGGVFAQLIGTVMLLDEEERDRIKGLIINKFRGDKKILEPGLEMITEKCGKTVLGVVPYTDADIEDEDSLSERLNTNWTAVGSDGNVRNIIDVAIIRFPKISNFTDFQSLGLENTIKIRYVSKAGELGAPDLIILPGTKNTINDLKWLRESGLETRILRLASQDTLIFGICGGYQMLGEDITDSLGLEGNTKHIRGLGLLPVCTAFEPEKQRTQTRGSIKTLTGSYAPLSGREVCGYEIHMGRTEYIDKSYNGAIKLADNVDGCCAGNVFGTYLHGIFDDEDFRSAFVKMCCDRKNIQYVAGNTMTYAEYKEQQFDLLADVIRANLDMKEVYKIIGI